MGQPVNFDLALTAADADGIALAQALGAAGDFNLNGALVTDGVAVLGTGMAERQVVLTSVGNDSALIFTLFGKNASGGDIQEALTGGNAGAVTTSQYFQTISRISSSGATAGNVTIGTNGVGASAWLVMDRHRTPFNVGFGVTVAQGGTVNYTVQHTFDDLLRAPPGFVPDVFPHETVAAQTTSQDGNYAFPVGAMRVQINSGTDQLTVAVIQAGLREG